eukprot:g1970.t1
MADVETTNKDAELRVSDLEDEDDLEVISAVVEDNNTTATNLFPNNNDTNIKQDTSSESLQQEQEQQKQHSSPPTETEDDRRSSGWSGFFGKRFGKGETVTQQKKKDWTKEQEAFSRFKTSAANTFSQMGTRMGESGSLLYEASKRRAQATAESLKKIRIFKTPLESLCKGESANYPCPRLLLVCCTAIASSGLSCQDIFKLDPPEELVTAVLNILHYGHGAVLPPAGATPEVLAGVIKKFLLELMEPLLTFKLSEEWIAAADDFSKIKMIIQQLPAVNRNVLELLLDCFHRISANAGENNMDSDTLAEAVVPCLLWRIPNQTTESSKKVQKTPGSIVRRLSKNSGSEGETPEHRVASSDGEDTAKHTNRVEITGEEFQKLIKVMSFMISNYKTE